MRDIYFIMTLLSLAVLLLLILSYMYDMKNLEYAYEHNAKLFKDAHQMDIRFLITSKAYTPISKKDESLYSLWNDVINIIRNSSKALTLDIFISIFISVAVFLFRNNDVWLATIFIMMNYYIYKKYNSLYHSFNDTNYKRLCKSNEGMVNFIDKKSEQLKRIYDISLIAVKTKTHVPRVIATQHGKIIKPSDVDTSIVTENLKLDVLLNNFIRGIILNKMNYYLIRRTFLINTSKTLSILLNVWVIAILVIRGGSF